MADDDVCEDWETLADSEELNRSIDKKNKKSQVVTESSNLQGLPLEGVSGGGAVASGPQIKILQRPQIIDENNTRSLMATTPQQQQVKILKRPEKTREEIEKNEAMNKVCQIPVKTFAQREAEYNKARQRIMGSTTLIQGDSPPNATSSQHQQEHIRKDNGEKKKSGNRTAAAAAGSQGQGLVGIGGNCNGISGQNKRLNSSVNNRNNYYYKNTNNNKR